MQQVVVPIAVGAKPVGVAALELLSPRAYSPRSPSLRGELCLPPLKVSYGRSSVGCVKWRDSEPRAELFYRLPQIVGEFARLLRSCSVCARPRLASSARGVPAQSDVSSSYAAMALSRSRASLASCSAGRGRRAKAASPSYRCLESGSARLRLACAASTASVIILVPSSSRKPCRFSNPVHSVSRTAKRTWSSYRSRFGALRPARTAAR